MMIRRLLADGKRNRWIWELDPAAGEVRIMGGKGCGNALEGDKVLEREDEYVVFYS